MSNIIVTGANGMIGWHVLQNLKDHQVWALDYHMNDYPEHQYFKKRYEASSKLQYVNLIQDDIINPQGIHDIIKNNHIDTIIHLAAKAGVAESIQYPSETLQHNQWSFINVLEAVRLYSPKTQIIFASSSSVYGKDTLECTPENSSLNPISPYGLSKLLNEQTAQFYQKNYNLKIIGLRFFTAYGEYNRQDMLIFKVIESIQKQKPLNLYHNGLMHRDFTYAGDIARIIEILCQQQHDYAYHLFNVGRGKSESILEVVKLCEQYFNQTANIQLVSGHPNYDPLITYADNTQILTYINNNMQFTSLENGLKNTVSWFKKLY